MNEIRNTPSVSAHSRGRPVAYQHPQPDLQLRGGRPARAPAPAAVALRDSKDRGGPVLLFDRAGWLGFIAGAKNGQFDLN